MSESESDGVKGGPASPVRNDAGPSGFQWVCCRMKVGVSETQSFGVYFFCRKFFLRWFV